VHIDDFIDISPAPAAFTVVDITPTAYGLVTPETEITIAARVGEKGPDYGSIDNPLECAMVLCKSLDYLSPRWCAESLAEFSEGLRRLVNLLEAPPPYSDSVNTRAE
jgi:hypothetical protein